MFGVKRTAVKTSKNAPQIGNRYQWIDFWKRVRERAKKKPIKKMRWWMRRWLVCRIMLELAWETKLVILNACDFWLCFTSRKSWFVVFNPEVSSPKAISRHLSQPHCLGRREGRVGKDEFVTVRINEDNKASDTLLEIDAFSCLDRATV